MNIIRLLAFITVWWQVAHCCAADLLQSPDHYTSVTISMVWVNHDQVDKPATFQIHLPTFRNLNGPVDGTIKFLQDGKGELRTPVNARLSQDICRIVSILLNNYKLVSSTPAPRTITAETLKISVNTGFGLETFSFSKADANSWKKAVDAWNAIRTQFGPQAAAIPTL